MTRWTIVKRVRINGYEAQEYTTLTAHDLLTAINNYLALELAHKAGTTPTKEAFKIMTDNMPPIRVEFWFDPQPEEGEPIIVLTLR